MKARSLFLAFGALLLIAISIYLYSSRQTVVSTLGQPTALQSGQRGGGLTIERKHIVVARKDSQLIILLDLYPNRKELEVAGDSAKNIVVTTASHYAKQYFSSPDNKLSESAVVHIVFVENMDEYNRADYAGMKRFGTLTFSKVGSDIVLSQDNLSKIP